MDLAGSSAIVTGGASGLGEATPRRLAGGHPRGVGGAPPRRLAAEDLRVVIVDVNDELGKRVADELGAVYVHADITSEGEVIDAVETACALAPLRALVSCAGGGGIGGRTIRPGGAFTSPPAPRPGQEEL